ncbi:MAG: NAD-dependent epimerase/dehydratase family protein [Bacillota bacterium]
MKVLVTGGAGFIGSHIVDELLEKKYEVVVIDNLITGHESRIPNGVKLIKADIRDSLDSAFMSEKPDVVIHQAAQVSVANSTVQPFYDADENIMGTINLLNLSVKYNIKKFIFASSAAIYGNPGQLPITENHPSQPISFYGLSKLTSESYIQLFSKFHGLSYAILRYSNVYGMRQDANGEAGVIAIFKEKILSGENPNIYGDGLQTRDFVFVKDVAKANAAAITYGNNGIYNISSNSQVTVLDIIKEFRNITNSNVTPVFCETREGDIRDSVLSNVKARTELNWSPEETIRTGLKKTMDHYTAVSIS